MCGIVAILSAGPPVDARILDAMRDRLAHRGPDGAGSWIADTSSGGVGLAHRRLSIIDLGQGGYQPKQSEDGACILTYNGEIYNYIELREELRQLGYVFRSNSDTEVLLNAYRAWGDACLAKLNGMYAFVLWDARKQEMFVARDRFGEKPLYMARLSGGGWAFASEMKALLVHPEVSDALNADFFNRFMVSGGALADETTPFLAVRRLMPASALRIAASGQEIARWRHWTPNFEADPIRQSQRDLIERFKGLLQDSLRMRLRSDVGVSASLSGGLDSSIMVAAAQETGNPVFTGQCFSARFDNVPAISEGNYIDMVNRSLGLQGYAVTPRGEDLARDSLDLHWHQELPFISSSMYVEWSVMRLAHQNGVKVIMNGQGPDELLGGYQTYFPRYQYDLVRRGRLFDFAVNTLLMGLRLRSLRKRHGMVENRIPFNPFWTGFLALVDVFHKRIDRDLPRRDGVPSSRGGNTFRHLIAEGSLYSILPEQLHSADANSMAFGIESRCPFLDNDLVDFCIRLPENMLIRNGWQKYIMRQAASPRLPQDIRWRADKVGFAGPQVAWMTGPMADWVEHNVSERRGDRFEAASRDTVVADWAALKAGTSYDSWRIWRWITLNQWLTLYDEGRWRAPTQGTPAPDSLQSGRA